MATANNVQAWSSTAASNNTADSTISSSDTQSPDTLDNDVRNIMAAVRNLAKDTGGALVAGGTSTALTITTNQVISSGHITNGYTLYVRTASAATGAATIAVDGIAATTIKRADGAAVAAGDWRSGDILILVYSTTATAFLIANIGHYAINGLTADAAPVATTDYVATYDASATSHKKVLLQYLGGVVLLTSGTGSGASLDLVLTSYTAYRGLRFVLSGFKPSTDGDALWMRFSTNGGSSYLSASNYKHASVYVGDSAVTGATGGTAAQINLSSGIGVGNASTEGFNMTLDMLNQTSAAFYTRVSWTAAFMDDGAPTNLRHVTGSGCYAVAQDTDAVQFLFSTGNISAGNYAIYGLA